MAREDQLTISFGSSFQQLNTVTGEKKKKKSYFGKQK